MTQFGHSPEPLLDHLVGAELDRRRQFDADRFGGLELDDQLEFFGLLNRESGGFRATAPSHDLLIILSPLARNIALHKFTP